MSIDHSLKQIDKFLNFVDIANKKTKKMEKHYKRVFKDMEKKKGKKFKSQERQKIEKKLKKNIKKKLKKHKKKETIIHYEAPPPLEDIFYEKLV
jgi:divalent metal cation (Fe/Co/Zn/Cd) transporter